MSPMTEMICSVVSCVRASTPEKEDVTTFSLSCEDEHLALNIRSRVALAE